MRDRTIYKVHGLGKDAIHTFREAALATRRSPVAVAREMLRLYATDLTFRECVNGSDRWIYNIQTDGFQARSELTATGTLTDRPPGISETELSVPLKMASCERCGGSGFIVDYDWMEHNCPECGGPERVQD